MVTRTVVVFGLLAIVACAPTGQREPQIIRDESGAAFYLRGFSAHEIPDVTPPAPACDDGAAGSYVSGYNQFFFIAAGCPAERGMRAGTARCVVCETESDCPDMNGGMFECRDGLCRNRNPWPPEESLCGHTTPRVSRPVAARLDKIVGSL